MGQAPYLPGTMTPNGSDGPSWKIPSLLGGLSGALKGCVARFSDSDAVVFIGLLDLYPATVGYSLRRLTGGATRAVAVRNDSNVTVDIGFLPEGELDTVALLAHCGAGNGYVVKWYNQETNGASGNFVQVTAAQQPRIVTAGVVLTRYGKPMIQMVGGVEYVYNEDNTLFQNKVYNRLYFTVSKPDGSRYDGKSPFGVGSPLGFGRVFLQFGSDIGSGRNLFASAQTGVSYNSAQRLYIYSDNNSPLQFGASISTINLQINWNANASGVADVCNHSTVTRHATDLVTTATFGGVTNTNSYNEVATRITIGGYWNGSAIVAVSQLLGYNEFILYTNAAQHSNDAAINTELAAYY